MCSISERTGAETQEGSLDFEDHEHAARDSAQQVEQAGQDAFLLHNCRSNPVSLLLGLFPEVHDRALAGRRGVHRRPSSDGGLEDRIQRLVDVAGEQRISSTVSLDGGRRWREQRDPEVGVVNSEHFGQIKVQAWRAATSEDAGRLFGEV